MMPAKHTSTRCVNPFPPVSIRVGISIQKPAGSHLVKTKPKAFIIWSWQIFNERDLIVKIRASTLQAYRRKLTDLVLMGFVLNAILCLKHWVASITSVPVKSCVHLSLKNIRNVGVRKEKLMNWGAIIHSKKISMSLNCDNVSVWDFTRKSLLLNYISERVSLTDDHLQNINFWNG